MVLRSSGNQCGGTVKRLKQAALVLLVAFAAAQFVRPSHSNPPIDPTRAIPAQMAALRAVVDRSCRDCHTSATVWPSVAQVAPLSWLMARAVSEGRKAVNFSEWMTYSPDVRRTLLSASCDDARSGKMPGPYTWVRSETRLSLADIDTICAAARAADTHSVELIQ
jgi:heme-binding protein